MFGTDVRLFPVPYVPSQLLSSSVEEYIRLWLPGGLIGDVVPANNHFLSSLYATPKMAKDLLVKMSRLEQEITSLGRGRDHDRDLVLGEVGDEFWDAGEGADGWPETVLADGTLCDVLVLRERDSGEEGEEVGRCFSFDLGRVRLGRCVHARRKDVRLPMSPALISQVIRTPYGARISSICAINHVRMPRKW